MFIRTFLVDANLPKYPSTLDTRCLNRTDDRRWAKPHVKTPKTSSSVTVKVKKIEETKKRSSAPEAWKKQKTPGKAHVKGGSAEKDTGAPEYRMFTKLSEERVVQMPAFSPSSSVPIPVLDTSSKKVEIRICQRKTP